MNRLGHIVFGLVIAAGLTASAVLVDRRITSRQKTDAALQWARQITAQAEGMVFSARTRGEKDPIGWAVGFLSQGVEPRVAQVQRFRSTPEKKVVDGYEFDASAGVLELTKVLLPETGAGVRVRVLAEYPGFLGAGNRFTSDLLVMGLFAVLFGLVTLARVRWAQRGAVPPSSMSVDELPDAVGPPVEAPASVGFVATVDAWTSRARGALTALGLNVRDLLKQTQAFGAASQRATPAVGALRERIHAGLAGIHEARRGLRETSESLGAAHEVTAKLLIEIDRLKLGRAGMGELVELLQRNLSETRIQQDYAARMLLDLERGIEPWTVEADLASAAVDEAAAAFAELSAKIDSAKKSLIAQASMLKELQGVVATEREEALARAAEAERAAVAAVDASVAEAAGADHEPELRAFPQPLPDLPEDPAA